MNKCCLYNKRTFIAHPPFHTAFETRAKNKINIQLNKSLNKRAKKNTTNPDRIIENLYSSPYVIEEFVYDQLPTLTTQRK